MKVLKTATITILILFSQACVADIFWAFRNEDGSTKWQYVANFSSSVLILALSFTAIKLFLSRRQAHRYNQALEEIKQELEVRVAQRTTNLNEANQLLQSTNEALAVEVEEHRHTAGQLARSEAYIASILQTMPLTLIGLDATNRITQWNRQAEMISGLNATDVVGKDLWACYPSIALTPEKIDAARRQHKPLTLKHSQRDDYHFNITIYPLEKHAETGVVVLIDNVTDQVKANNLLIQRDKMSSMGEMTAVMAQDINLPLSASLKEIQRVRQALADEFIDPEELNELLENALIRGQQASNVIENLLAFSTGGGGEKVPAQLAAILDHSLELANSLLGVTSGLRFKDIAVMRDYALNTPPVACHTTELQQVFLSIFRHACHSLAAVDTDDHVPKMRIQVSAQDHFVVIRIHHNGETISLDEQQYIFEPYAVHRATDNAGRVGRRLSFTHFIVAEQHHGNIAVTSDNASGTTFHVQIPIA